MSTGAAESTRAQTGEPVASGQEIGPVPDLASPGQPGIGAPGQQAEDEAFARGFAAAREERSVGAEARWNAQLARLDLSVERLRALEQVMLAESRETVADLAVRLAQRLLERELATTPGTLLELTRAVVAEASGVSEVTLLMHPRDLEALTVEDQALRQAVGGGSRLHLEADPSLERGDCVVRADGGVLDGRLRVRLDALRLGVLDQSSREPERGGET